MKTTIEIADVLLEEAKAYAAARGVSLRGVVEEGLRIAIRQTPAIGTGFRLRDGAFGPFRENTTWPRIRRAIYRGRGES